MSFLVCDISNFIVSRGPTSWAWLPVKLFTTPFLKSWLRHWTITSATSLKHALESLILYILCIMLYTNHAYVYHV